MPKVRRFSGRLKIELTHNDRSNQYQVKLCPIAPSRDVRREKVTVGSRNVRTAVDAPEAFTDAARAAISFSSDDIQQLAQSNRQGSGWLVRRGRSRKGVRSPR